MNNCLNQRKRSNSNGIMICYEILMWFYIRCWVIGKLEKTLIGKSLISKYVQNIQMGSHCYKNKIAPKLQDFE